MDTAARMIPEEKAWEIFLAKIGEEIPTECIVSKEILPTLTIAKDVRYMVSTCVKKDAVIVTLTLMPTQGAALSPGLSPISERVFKLMPGGWVRIS
jgi:hypothetical protein